MDDRNEMLQLLEKERKARLEAENRLEESLNNHTLEMARSASRLTNLISNMQEAVLVEDENRMIVLVNEQFCSMFGIPVAPDYMIGTDCSSSAEASKHFFSDPEGFVKQIDKILNIKEKVIGEILELADGRTFIRDYVPIIIEGNYKGHYWKYADITRQKRSENALIRSEEKYRLLIENMNLGLLEVDMEGKIVYANKSFCKMSGFRKQDIYGKVAENLFTHEDNRDLVRQKTDSRSKGVLDAYELEVTNHQGQKRWWMISGAPVYNQEGTQIGSTGIHLDITEQKQLEFNLRDAKQHAEDTAKAKEIFLANMSHEIRTPMNAILGLGNQLIKTKLNRQQTSYLGAINTAAENLLVIINDILDFSKIESGKFTLESINFSLHEVLQQLASILSGKAEEKELVFSLKIDPAVSPYLVGDPYRLNQVLINLIGNSIKFTNKGSIILSCQVIENQEKQQTIEITVQDTGIGIDKQYLKNIFRKFSQESPEIARKFGGTGLGLTISKQLIDLMGGNIIIDSNKNIGTKITIRLNFPIGQETIPESISEDENDFSKLKGLNILLVEDNKVNRLIANAILTKVGIKVTEANNGEIALNLLRINHFDLVLMDMQMPVLDGISATQILRKEISKTIPVIALTAHALKSEESRCIEAGMNDFISKPFTEQKLLQTILKYVE